MKPKTITNGPRWMRYPIFFIFISNVFNVIIGYNLTANLTSATICGGLVFLLWIYRKVKYDDKNVYFISGNRKKVVPYETITELKRSKSRVNGDRFWILKYENENGSIKTRRFFHGIFRDGPKDFHQKLKAVNPGVNIQFTSKYSLMVDSFKRSRDKRLKKKRAKEMKKHEKE